MHPAYIQAELKRKGVTQNAIATKFKVSASFVSKLIRGETSSHRIARFIARTLGKPVHELWPDRYHNQPRRKAA